MLDRRRSDRTRNLAVGTIAYGRDRKTLDCVVRNLSEGGALLLLDEPLRAPVEMELATRGGVRSARVVWRNETSVGVVFTAPRPAPAPAAVVSLDDVRRHRAGGVGGAGERRLAERIARFVRPAPRPLTV